MFGFGKKKNSSVSSDAITIPPCCKCGESKNGNWHGDCGHIFCEKCRIDAGACCPDCGQFGATDYKTWVQLGRKIGKNLG